MNDRSSRDARVPAPRRAGHFLVGVAILLLTACPTTPKRAASVTPLQVEPPAETTNKPVPEVVDSHPQGVTNKAAGSPALAGWEQRIPRSGWIPLQRWAELNNLPPPHLTGLGPDCEIEAGPGVLVVKTGLRQALWNGSGIGLGFRPFLTNNQLQVHVLDARKNLQPLLEGPLVFNRTNLIVIDPGHGGDNPGTRSVFDNGLEKDLALDWSRRLARLCEAQGYKVALTRTNDASRSLYDRIAFANQTNAALFISLHFNSFEGKGATAQAGLETYCVTPRGMPSNLTRGYEDDPSRAFPNNAFDDQNLQLAVRVHQALVRATGRVDRGVRRARFMTVLREQPRPAILVEGGYLSHPEEAKLISDPNFRQKLAEGVFQALID